MKRWPISTVNQLLLKLWGRIHYLGPISSHHHKIPLSNTMNKQNCENAYHKLKCENAYHPSGNHRSPWNVFPLLACLPTETPPEVINLRSDGVLVDLSNFLRSDLSPPSKHETSTQCWASVVNGGPTLGRYIVFAGQYSFAMPILSC